MREMEIIKPRKMKIDCKYSRLYIEAVKGHAAFTTEKILETCGIDKVWQNFFNKYGKADETERNKIKSTLLRCLNCSYSAVTATGLKLAYECYFNQGNDSSEFQHRCRYRADGDKTCRDIFNDTKCARETLGTCWDCVMTSLLKTTPRRYETSSFNKKTSRETIKIETCPLPGIFDKAESLGEKGIADSACEECNIFRGGDFPEVEDEDPNVYPRTDKPHYDDREKFIFDVDCSGCTLYSKHSADVTNNKN
jgi:hypothetical protein